MHLVREKGFIKIGIKPLAKRNVAVLPLDRVRQLDARAGRDRHGLLVGHGDVDDAVAVDGEPKRFVGVDLGRRRRAPRVIALDRRPHKPGHRQVVHKPLVKVVASDRFC